MHGSENLLKATRCSHTVALSLNTCFGFFGALTAPSIVTQWDEAIREAGKGIMHSVGKSRKQVEESRAEREGRREIKG